MGATSRVDSGVTSAKTQGAHPDFAPVESSIIVLAIETFGVTAAGRG